MSNLYKQWYVRTEASNARVIDSNVVMAECLGKGTQGQTPEANGFEEGITVSPAEEAEQLLADAKASAEELVGQAEREASEIRENARRQGYQEGKQKQEEELSGLRRELEASYRKKQENLELDYTEKRKNMEKDLVDVIVEVFNRVFHIQFDNKKEILMYLIEHAVLNIEGEKKFRIKVDGGNVLFLETHREEISDRVGHDIELEILADSTLDGNDCVIETDSGVFDCSLGVQLENLIKDIRSLCS